MKLIVLLDNHTLIDRYFLGEPGVSYFIETDGKKILFDVGYSDAFISNAKKCAIDLLDIDTIVLSHGHLDHTWGLVPLIRLITEAMIEGYHVKRPSLVTHPVTLLPKKSGTLPEIGALLTPDKLSGYFDLQLSSTPVYLTDRLIFLGEIERHHAFETMHPTGTVMEDGIEKDDFLCDDSALVYKSSEGLVIITGCSHSGICNIIEYAKKICGDDRIRDIIGGFHLLHPSSEQLKGTAAYMKQCQPISVHACHCTDDHSKIALSRVIRLEEVGVGLRLEYP